MQSQSEDQIQAKFYQQAYNTYPAIRGLLFSVPNGSTRHPLEAMKLKATGLTPGIPDMILLWAGKAYGFEFKTTIGQLSQSQRAIHATWISNGIPVYVVRSCEEAILQLQKIILI
jgi:hypothetical protein